MTVLLVLVQTLNKKEKERHSFRHIEVFWKESGYGSSFSSVSVFQPMPPAKNSTVSQPFSPFTQKVTFVPPVKSYPISFLSPQFIPFCRKGNIYATLPIIRVWFIVIVKGNRFSVSHPAGRNKMIALIVTIAVDIKRVITQFLVYKQWYNKEDEWWRGRGVI